MPSQASGVETLLSPTPPVLIISVHSAPMESAKITFLARPNKNSSTPRSISAALQRFL